MYRNVTDFWMLTLYILWLCWIDLLILTGLFFCRIFVFYLWSYYLGTYSITRSFPIWTPFISFSCLITLARTSSTVLKRSGESGHSCLIPDCRGKSFSPIPLSMMYGVSFSHMVFYYVKVVCWMSLSWNASSVKCILSNAFSASVETIMWYFSPSFC